MTELLCQVWDREIFENETELNKYFATLRKENDKNLYTKYSFNINLDEFDKILSDYISHNNKKIYLYFFKLTFELKFNNNITQCIDPIIIQIMLCNTLRVIYYVILIISYREVLNSCK